MLHVHTESVYKDMICWFFSNSGQTHFLLNRHARAHTTARLCTSTHTNAAPDCFLAALSKLSCCECACSYFLAVSSLLSWSLFPLGFIFLRVFVGLSLSVLGASSNVSWPLLMLIFKNRPWGSVCLGWAWTVKRAWRGGRDSWVA